MRSPDRARSSRAAAKPWTRNQARSAATCLLPGSDKVSAVELLRTAGPDHLSDLLDRLELIEVGRGRVGNHGHPGSARSRTLRWRSAVLIGQGVAEHRHHPGDGDAGQLLQELRSGGEQPGITTESVEDERTDPRPIVGLEQRPRPIEMRESAAAINVADEQYSSIGSTSHRHVRQVRIEEIDLGGTACPLDDDQVELLEQAPQAAFNRGPQ